MIWLVAVIALAPVDSVRPRVPVAIEQRFAGVAHLGVGDSIALLAPDGARRRAFVSAIYQPAPDPSTIMRRDYHVVLPLPDLAELLGAGDRVDRFGVVLRPGIDADSAAARLNRTAFGYTVYPSRQIASQSSVTFLVVSRFHRAIAVISVTASAIFLLCLMTLKVEERRRDVALLRFTGISRATVFRAVMLETVVIALVGALAGIGVAAAASAIVNHHFQRVFATTLIFSEWSWHVAAFASTVSLALGVGAGAIAAWRLVRTPAMALWRRGA